MAYERSVTRQDPTCLLFAIDQSSSMADVFAHGERGKSKAESLADAINRMLYNFTITCAKEEGVRYYFDVGLLSYRQPSHQTHCIESAFAGPLAGRALVPLPELADSPLRIEERQKQASDGAGGLVSETIKFPVWLEPRAEGGTPMCGALEHVYQILSRWVAAHQESYPPIVIHITDGEATDGDPEHAAEAIKGLATKDGNVLLFNCHLSSHAGAPCMFPESETGLADEFAQRLFRMSSVLPEQMRKEAQARQYAVGAEARGFAFQADFVTLVHFLNIGTPLIGLR